jgi:hypothetical protein
LQWYDTLSIPATPLVPDHDEEVSGGHATPVPPVLHVDEERGDHVAPVPPVSSHVPAPDMQAELAALECEHEDAARKQRVRRKRAVDSAFKARRSSRLASKEAPQFISMLSKAKAVKASLFDYSGDSPRLRAAAEAAGFGGGSDPGPIPLLHLKELAATCGVNPDAVDDDAEVPSSST